MAMVPIFMGFLLEFSEAREQAGLIAVCRFFGKRALVVEGICFPHFTMWKRAFVVNEKHVAFGQLQVLRTEVHPIGELFNGAGKAGRASA